MTDDAVLRQEMLDKLKNAVPVVQPVAAPVPAVVEPPKEGFEQDYDYTRDKLKNLVNIGEDAIEHFIEIAKETNEPRAFEVLATLLKNTGELAKGVIDNATSKANIDTRNQIKTVGDKDKPTTNNTTIFVGTTKDLLEKLNQPKMIEGEVTEVK